VWIHASMNDDWRTFLEGYTPYKFYVHCRLSELTQNSSMFINRQTSSLAELAAKEKDQFLPPSTKHKYQLTHLPHGRYVNNGAAR
jgi:hypothetical protein